jgi:hypothetical protein
MNNIAQLPKDRRGRVFALAGELGGYETVQLSLRLGWSCCVVQQNTRMRNRRLEVVNTGKQT